MTDTHARDVRPAPASRRPNSVPRWPVLTLGIASALGFTMVSISLWSVDFALFGVGLLALVPPLAAIHYGKNGLLSYWTPALLSILIGITLRSAMITFDYPNHQTLDGLFLRGLDPVDLLRPSIYALACITALAAGAMMAEVGVPTRRDYAFRHDIRLSPDRILVFAAATMIGVVGLIGFVRSTGGFDISQLSAKRDRVLDLEAGTTSTGGSATAWRYLGSLSVMSLYALFTLSVTDPRPMSAQRRIALTGMAIVACALPFYGSQRGEVVNILLALAVVSMLSGKAISPRRVLPLILIALLVVNSMTGLRSSGQDDDLATLLETLTVINITEISDSILLNRSLFDIGKTSQIYYETGSNGALGTADGSTIYTYAIAPVPRALWPAKPLVAPGQQIGRKVYNSANGIPPGLAGELKWNFGTFTAVVICLAVGFVFQLADQRLRNRMQTPSDVVVYAIVFYPLLGRLLGGSIGGSLLKTTALWVTWWATSRWFGVRRRSK